MGLYTDGRIRMLAYAYAAELGLALALTAVFFANRAAGLLAWDIVPGIQVLVAGFGAWLNYRLTGRKIWAAAALFLVYMAFSETFEFHRIIGLVLLHWHNGPLDLISTYFPCLLIHRHPQTIPIVATSVLWLMLIPGLFKQVQNSLPGFITFCLSLIIMAAVIGEYLLLCKYGKLGALRFGPAWGIRQVAELFGTFSLGLSFAFVAKANKDKLQSRRPDDHNLTPET